MQIIEAIKPRQTKGGWKFPFFGWKIPFYFTCFSFFLYLFFQPRCNFFWFTLPLWKTFTLLVYLIFGRALTIQSLSCTY